MRHESEVWVVRVPLRSSHFLSLNLRHFRQRLRRVHCTDWESDLWMEYLLRFTSYFLKYFISHVTKGIKNGCPCIVGIRSTWSCALATSLHSPTARAWSPEKAQLCVPLISTMHGQPFLIPSSKSLMAIDILCWVSTCDSWYQLHYDMHQMVSMGTSTVWYM